MNLYRKASLLFIIVMLLSFITPVLAFEPSQLQWKPGTSAKLMRGEVFTYNGYSVEVIAFPPPTEADRYNTTMPAEPVTPFVGLNLSKNNGSINTIILGLSESYITTDGELKITATVLPTRTSSVWLYESYAPSATIEMSQRGTPEFELLLQTDEDSYFSSPTTDITLDIQLENAGYGDATNVDMKIQTELPLKSGYLKYHYDRVKKNYPKVETIKFSAPIVTKEKAYEIVLNVSGYDAKDIYYTKQIKKTIIVKPEPEKGLTIKKTVNNRIYLKDYAMVSITIKNHATHEIRNVSIKDYLLPSFETIGNKSFDWMVDIPANGEWEYRYLVRPLEINSNGIVLPSATAEYRLNKEFYGIRSNQPSVKVYGPDIEISKNTNVSVIDINQTVSTIKVTVTTHNKGNTPTKVMITDKLPDNSLLISGVNTHEEFLEANRKTSFSYVIIVDSPPPIILPPAEVEYYELGISGKTRSVSSSIVNIGVKVQKPEVVIEFEPDVTPESTPIQTLIPTPTVIETPVVTNSSTKPDFNMILKAIFRCDDYNLGNGSYACKIFK